MSDENGEALAVESEPSDVEQLHLRAPDDGQALEAKAEKSSSTKSQSQSKVTRSTPKRELGSIKASDLSSRRVLH